MRRRDFVKGVVAVPVAASTVLGQQAPAVSSPPLPSNPPVPGATPAAPRAAAPAGFGRRGMSDFKAPPVTTIVPDAIAAPEVRFFTEPQLGALSRLSDLLMPPLNGYPGALQAEAPQFLDFLVSASPDDIQQLYRSGLDRLNEDAKKKFDTAFAKLNDKQADAIVRPAFKPWMQWHPPTEPFGHFIANAHDDIRKATMNSEAWSQAAIAAGERTPGVGLFWYPIDPDMKKWV